MWLKKNPHLSVHISSYWIYYIWKGITSLIFWKLYLKKNHVSFINELLLYLSKSIGFIVSKTCNVLILWSLLTTLHILPTLKIVSWYIRSCPLVYWFIFKNLIESFESLSLHSIINYFYDTFSVIIFPNWSDLVLLSFVFKMMDNVI
jgi:hypothetical protein